MEDAIKQFRGITGLGSDDEAKMWLEMAGGDLSIAMGLFFNDGATTTTSSSTKKKEKDENEIVWGSSRKPSGKVLEAWRQGFVFAEKFKGAIVQLKNGPCGVIAVVQALILSRRLSEREKSLMFETLFHASVTDDELAFVLSSIILKCRDDGDATQAGIAIWKDTFEKATLKTSKDGIQALVRDNISMFRNEFGMLRLVYSMVLSRGVNQIQKDLNDDAESPLIGSSRGLCSFELMSLLLRGVANGDIGAFNQVTRAPQDWNRDEVLGGIGLLSSEFERRVGVQICNALKIPKAPIFIIHGGDHFTVMVASDGKSFELAIDSSSKSRTIRFFTYNQGPVRNVRARSARIFIIVLKYSEYHCITHSHHCTLDNIEYYHSPISSNITKYLIRASRSNTGTCRSKTDDDRSSCTSRCSNVLERLTQANLLQTARG